MLKNTVLSLAAVVATTFVAVACDTGTNVTPCTEDTECDTTEICAVPEGSTEGSCVTPICAEDSDCDLQDTSTGSPIADTAEFEGTCEDEGYVTIVGFDGNDYCAVEQNDEFSCADDLEGDEVAVTAAAKSGGTVDVCVLADGTCDFDGTCS